MNSFVAVCVREARNELVPVECENLTGGRPDADGLAPCQSIDLIQRAAYVRCGVRLIAAAETVDSLTQAIRQQSCEAKDFRIELARFSERNTANRQQTIRMVADAIPAFPNLEEPKHRFMLALLEDGFWFGEILVEADHAYSRHDSKPWRTSSSLPSRLARAMVNLVSPPARTILDPLCGTGSILLEASAIGLDASGCDWNPRMVGMSRKNLAHFGYTAEVVRGNALEYARCADVVVTDLPYGKFLHKDEKMLQQILAHCAGLAPLGVFAAGEDIRAGLLDAGYGQVELFSIQHRANFSRFIHRARIGP